MSVGVVIPAAGQSLRMKLDGDSKAFLELDGIPVIIHSLRKFYSLSFVENIVVTTRDEDIPRVRKMVDFWHLKDVTIVPGGSSRQESVFLGLQALPKTTNWVFIHDAARPLIATDIINRSFEAVKRYGAVGVGVPVKDTIKEVDDGLIVHTPDRSRLWAMQTPQVFDYQLIVSAHKNAVETGFEGTDDCALVEKLNHPVYVVCGDYANLKITTPEDVQIAKALNPLAQNQGEGVRDMVGFGYDVHRLSLGRKLFLCGVEIPFEKGLEGHSDADVAIHALMDAILGASALGDIGHHFPDTDPTLKGIASHKLLTKVCALIAPRYEIGNIDITIVAQKPKLAPFVPKMRQNLAEVIGLPINRVNVKATTTEGLGFAGREEGIAAYAVCTVRRLLD